MDGKYLSRYAFNNKEVSLGNLYRQELMRVREQNRVG